MDDTAEMLVTVAIDDRSAVEPSSAADPARAITAIAEGLRRLHSLPIQDCPYDWSAESRLAGTRLRQSPPSVDQLVVCHGDPCAPNTLLDNEGMFLANVDFGRLGVADRWADLAVAAMSLGWNYDGYDENQFWDAYGIEPDQDRIAYYSALWSAG